MAATITEPTIPQFFAGKNVFITGATGFLGKALIEKLLRNCPDIENIYILIRPKKGKLMQDRIQILINDAIYERVKREQPNLEMHKKIIAISGDVTKLELGLSLEDRNVLIEKVHIIYHVAASVRFDDRLNEAIMMNIRGTREICQLALDAKNLVAYMHVSTAFVNCDRVEAKEVLYPASMDWRQTIEIAEKYDKNVLNILTHKILNVMPNTYCFTKNIAENVVHDMLDGKISCQIFRPSVVCSTMLAEPVEGWNDNFNGPLGIMVACGVGVMRCTYAGVEYSPDYIPVDVVIKALIVSTWDLSIRRSKTLEIMHATSYDIKWIRFNSQQLSECGLEAWKDYPLDNAIWPVSGHYTGSAVVCYLRTIFTMLIPSMIIDGVLKLSGHKPMLTKLQLKIYTAQWALRYFMNNNWLYHNDNLLSLQHRIQETDKQAWDYEFRDFDPIEFMKNSLLGVRRFLLKQPDSTLPLAKKRRDRLYLIQKIVYLVLYAFVLWRIYIYLF